MPIVNEDDLTFSKDLRGHLGAVLDLLGIKDKSDLRAAAEELADLLDEPENAVVIDRAMILLSNALRLPRSATRGRQESRRRRGGGRADRGA